jgi:AcrR family transcriptional regulator
MATVKRTYDATGRQAKAQLTREALMEAARTSLLTVGYAATTLPGVASTCRVSVDLVYKRFGSKAGLVRAVVENALLGAGSVPAEARADALADRGLELAAGWGALAAEVAPRVAPLLLLLRTASSHDPDLLPLAESLDKARRVRMTANAKRLAATGDLRPGLTVKATADLLWTFSSPEVYELLVLRSGWDAGRYGRFVTEAIAGQLLR